MGNNKNRAIRHIRRAVRKGDHVVLLSKNGEKKFLDSLSSSMNSSNKVLIESSSLTGKSSLALKKQLVTMAENKLTPVVRLEDFEGLSRNLQELIRDLESRNFLIIN